MNMYVSRPEMSLGGRQEEGRGRDEEEEEAAGDEAVEINAGAGHGERVGTPFPSGGNHHLSFAECIAIT